jgi:hypothetical protein
MKNSKPHGKTGKSSIGSGRVNEVGDDVSTPMRVPLSLQDSVRSLIKLQRGKAACPQLYAAIAIYSVLDVFGDRLDSLPSWSAELFKIKSYFHSLLEGLYHLYGLCDKTSESGIVIDDEINRLEDLLDKLEYTFCELTLYRCLKENLLFIEQIDIKTKKIVQTLP